MNLRFLLVVAFLLPAASSAQQKVDRAKVHADFYGGAIPPSREFFSTVAGEKARLVLVAYHLGWDDQKLAKELKLSPKEISESYGLLTDRGLVAHRSGGIVPAVPVIRDRDVERLSETLDAHSRDFASLLERELGNIEALLPPLPGITQSRQDYRRYAALISGVLFGGMIDVFAEDKTFLPPPSRRSGGQYYGWLVESDPVLAGNLIREGWDSDGYQIVSLGASLPDLKPDVTAVRRDGFVLEDADARRFRSSAIVLSRDKLLPFFKRRRDEFLRAHQRVEAGKYTSFASFFAWYYTLTVQRAVDRMVAAKTLPRPACPCVYALRTAVR